MKKFAILVVTLFSIFAIVSCSGGGGKYGDAIKVMENYVDLFDGFIGNLENANNGPDVAKALDTFSAGMKDLVPKLKELDAKYPELKGKDVPAELKPIMDRLQNEIIPKFGSVMGKIAQFQNDPAVVEANKRFQEAMMEMSKK
jgi:hypothetical protein